MLLEKDPAIYGFLANLRAELGADAFQIVDPWSADLCAIGIAAPTNRDRLAYVSTAGVDPGR